MGWGNVAAYVREPVVKFSQIKLMKRQYPPINPQIDTDAKLSIRPMSFMRKIYKKKGYCWGP
jgi:hypothetical protein